jgi:hypothetical protein
MIPVLEYEYWDLQILILDYLKHVNALSGALINSGGHRGESFMACFLVG